MEIHKAFELNKIFKERIRNFNSHNTINDTKYKKLKYFSPPHILNLFTNIAKNKNIDFINFVLPANENISLLSSVFIAMEMMKENYNNIIKNYSEILQPGINVELTQNGKIYKFMGKSEKYEKFVRIETIPYGEFGKASIEKEIKNIFQFFPTKKEINKKNVGTSDWTDTQLSNLDRILGTTTFNNPVLIKNNVILLTERAKAETFFKSQYLNCLTLDQIIKKSFINDNGEVEGEYEPLLLYTNSLNNLYEYFKKNKKEKIIISDSVSKLSDITLINQIKEINDSKFMLFSNEKDFELIQDLYNKKKHQVWKFEKKEINEWYTLDVEKISEVPKDDIYEAFKFDNATKIKVIFANTVEQNIQYTDFRDDIFDDLTLNIKKLSKINTENSEEIKEHLSNIYILKHKLQDFIFGPNEEMTKFYNKTIESLKVFFDYNKKFFSNEEFDLLNKIITIIDQIDINNPELFKSRRDELQKKFMDELSIHNKINTTIIVDSPKIINYYKKNLKEEWNLEIEINTTLSPRKVFKYGIVTSEFGKHRIAKVLSDHKYKVINFFATSTIKEKIKDVLSNNEIKWKKFYLKPEEKVKICNLEKQHEPLFYYPEHMNYTTDILKNIGEKTDWDSFFSKPFDASKLKKESSDPNDIESRVIVFYGDSYGYFTENTDFKVINSLLNILKRKEQVMKSVDFKDLKIDDYLLLRDSSDRDVIESEAKLMLKSENDYHSMKTQCKKWHEILVGCLKDNNEILNINNLYEKMEKFGYDKSKLTLKNLINNLVICPDDEIDLKILIKSLEEITKKKLISEVDLRNVYRSAVKIKTLHRRAGRNMSKKILLALRDQDVDVGREPVRVDYNKDGTISLNKHESESPEAWIVQIQEIKTDQYKASPSDINRLQY